MAARAGVAVWGLWALLALAWFATLGARPVFDPDEARYAEIPREMVASGDWVTPRLNGLKYFEKPVLQYWGTAAIYELVGVSDGASKLWAMTLAFLCLPLVAAFAVAGGASQTTALRAALLLGVSPFFVPLAQINLLDQGFAFFCSAMLFAFVLAQLAPPGSRDERRWMRLAWAGLALAVLSKGIVAIVLTGATLLAYMALERDLTPLRRMHFLQGVPLFLLICVPWFWLVQQRNPEFAGFFFVHEHFARFLTTVHRRTEPFWYFIPIIAFSMLPVLGYLKRAVTQAWAAPRAPGGGFRAHRFLLLWCVLNVVFFSLSQSKLAPYVLPVMPPLAVLLAAAIGDDRRAARAAAWVTSLLLWTFAVAIVVYDARRDGVVDRGLIVWSIVAALAAMLPFLATRVPAVAAPQRRSEPAAVQAAWLPVALTAILGWQALTMAYSELPPERSAKALVDTVRAAVGPQTQLFSVAQYRHSITYYLGRNLRLVGYKGELEFGLDQQDLGYIDDLSTFARVWSDCGDAVAFIDPKSFLQLRAAGLPGRVLATDDPRSIVLSRH